MRKLCVLGLFLHSLFSWAAGPIDLESPFQKAVLIKNEKGEIQRKLVTNIRAVGENFEGVSQDGAITVMAKNSVVAVLPYYPDVVASTASVRSAIRFLEESPEELRKSAEISPKVMALWDEYLKQMQFREQEDLQEKKMKEEEKEAKSKASVEQDSEVWLSEARNFLKPRSESEINELKKRGVRLLDNKNTRKAEIEDCLAYYSQVLPKEKGGPLLNLAQLTALQSDILPDDGLIWFAAGVCFVSLFLLLIGLSYLSNVFTYSQMRRWGRAGLYLLLTPVFFVALFYLWWPSEERGRRIEPMESESFKEMNVLLKNKAKPDYYFPKKRYSFTSEEFISGILSALAPSDKLVGYLKGRMSAGKLMLDNQRWIFDQGISILALPLDVTLRFEGAWPGADNWQNPRIDSVMIGKTKLPQFLASGLENSMLNTFREALQVSGLQGLVVSGPDAGKISILIHSAGVRPSYEIQVEKEGIMTQKEFKKPLKKYIAAEELFREIDDYQGRFVFVDGVVLDVESGGEYSGDSKTVNSRTSQLGKGSGGLAKALGDKPGGQIGLDRYDIFLLSGGLKCKVKSSDVFTRDERGDIYLGPRANTVQDEPLIKKGKRVKFLTEGRVEGKEVYGIRIDQASDITCYDPMQVVDFPALEPVALGDSDFDLSASATSQLPISFYSSDPSVAEIYKRNRVKIKKVGTTTITAVQEGDGIWQYASATQTLVVEPAK